MDRVQKMSIEFGCEPANEGFARVSVAAFAARLNPTIEEVSDIKMAVSEAVMGIIRWSRGGYVLNVKLKEICLLSVSKITAGVYRI